MLRARFCNVKRAQKSLFSHVEFPGVGKGLNKKEKKWENENKMGTLPPPSRLDLALPNGVSKRCLILITSR